MHPDYRIFERMIKTNNMARHFISWTFSLLFLFCFSFTFKLSAQIDYINPTSDPDYPKEWRAIDSLQVNGLYRSALTKVQELALQAKADQKPAQVVKTLLYAARFERELSEREIPHAIEIIESAFAESEFPERPILATLLADLYQKHLDENAWQLQDRSVRSSTDDDSVLENWSADRIQQKVFDLHAAAIQDERLKETSIESFKVLFPDRPRYTENLRPTLFDIISHRAVDYFTNTRSYLNEPAQNFSIRGASYFGSAEEFVGLTLPTPKTSSKQHEGLRILQALLQFRLADDNLPALIDLDLKRLDYLRSESVDPQKDKYYIAALQKLATRYGRQPGAGLIHLKLAFWHRQKARQYNPLSGDTLKTENQKALAYCQEILEHFPDSYSAEKAKGLQQDIQQKQLEVQTEEVLLPMENALANLKFRNLDQAYFRIIKLDVEQEEKINNLDYDKRWPALLKIPALRQWTVALLDDGDHNLHQQETLIRSIENGRYAMIFSSDSDFNKGQEEATDYFTFSVSNIGFLNRQDEDRNQTFVLLNRKTGQPLEGVKATFYQRNYNNRRGNYQTREVGSAYSDNRGMLTMDKRRTSFVVKFTYEEDELFFQDTYYNGEQAPDEREPQTFTNFFLDRSIYRPGQTIFFKGILTQKGRTRGDIKILKNKKITITFRNANYQTVSTQSFRTNDFGTFNGELTAPSGGLLGQMSIESDLNGRASFRVEEYKRPRFQVLFDPLEGSYKLQDSIAVKGKAMAFAGNAVDGAMVQYRVLRTDLAPLPWYRAYYFRPYGYQKNVEITNGITQTDVEGGFQINFTAIPNEDIELTPFSRFRYEIKVDVVDITGETRSQSTILTIGESGFTTRIELSDQIDRAGTPVQVKVISENHQQQSVNTQGKIQVYALNAPNQVFKSRYWQEPDLQAYTKENFKTIFPDYAFQGEDRSENWERGALVWETDYQSEDPQAIQLPLSVWDVGHYQIHMQSSNENGELQTFQQNFQLFDSQAKSIPEGTNWWSFLTKETYEPGENAVFWAASSGKPRSVLLEIERESKFLRSEWLKLENWLTIEQEVQEIDRGNIHLSYTSLFNNRLETGHKIIRVPYSNKDLKIEYLSFRDKLKPGAEETWTLKVSGPDKEAVAAEMVASMYDASLDQFVAHNWNLSLYSYDNYPSHRWRNRYFGLQSQRANTSYPYFNSGLYDRQYLDFNWFGLLQTYMLQEMVVGYSSDARSSRRSANLESAPPPPPPQPKGAMPSAEKLAAYSDSDSETSEMDSTEGGQNTATEEAPLSIRKNLNETVFFFPELRTDAEGNVLLNFQMNEALTSWKFLALAHTQDLKVGLSQQEVITQKELMVLPNAPRFVREGDQFQFTGKVSNISEQALSGKAWIEFTDTRSGANVHELLGLTEIEIPFDLEIGRSAPLSWTLNIPEGDLATLTYRIYAQSGAYSDGEENILPVLGNRILVTESMPISVRSQEERSVDFQAFRSSMESSTAKAHHYTVEFCSNPAWFALQSMPYLMEYPHECSEQLFNRFYANSLASSLMNRYPAIQGMVENWKGTDALESPLSKNEELKAVLLEETPWVLEAKSEAEQRAQLALLFDLNRMGAEQRVALDKLASQQNENGAFTWFSGGPDNWYITTYIMAGLGHLQALNAFDSNNNATSQQILSRAITFSDETFLGAFQEMMRLAKAGKLDLDADFLRPGDIQYLYARSFFLEDHPFPKSMDRAIKFYTEQAQKYWLKKGLQQQAQVGIISKRMEISGLANKIHASLAERALQSEELGMYWKYPKGYYWHEAPVETQALMIEFFQNMGDQKSVDEQKIWLLKNKQTQSWSTTKSTAEAIYALLYSEKETPSWMETQLVDIQFPKLKKKLAKAKMEKAMQEMESGTGYLKMEWTPEEISTDLATIKIKNPNNGISWGAAYWQYFEDLDKVKTFSDTPLELNKQLYKSVNTESGPELVLLDGKQSLQPGDKIIVRIELSVDRDMEFIHLKDMRASGLEPINVLSQYKWQGGLGYYESTKDVATHFFMDYLPKGTYVFEYPLRVQLAGDFSNGISTIQSMYAPEFTAHSEGQRLKITAN